MSIVHLLMHFMCQMDSAYWHAVKPVSSVILNKLFLIGTKANADDFSPNGVCAVLCYVYNCRRFIYAEVNHPNFRIDVLVTC